MAAEREGMGAVVLCSLARGLEQRPNTADLFMTGYTCVADRWSAVVIPLRTDNKSLQFLNFLTTFRSPFARCAFQRHPRPLSQP